MAAKRKARKTRSQPSESALARVNKAKAQDVDYTHGTRQIAFLGHLGSIHKGKSSLKLVSNHTREDDFDSLPIMILSFLILVTAASIFAIAFLDIPDMAFRFRP